jgi:hypothetical protein
VATVTVTLMEADAIPAEVNVGEIAEDALQAAFALIGARLTLATGTHTFGDFAPDETLMLEDVFRLFVRAMAVNNEACLAREEV